MENSNQIEDNKMSSLDAIINSLKCISNKLDERDTELKIIIDKLIDTNPIVENPEFLEKYDGEKRMPVKSIPVIENIIFNIEEKLNSIFYANKTLKLII